uniref:Uncharacterized protein n=1 Tax=Arundo donax TaxID=35708 RepID=A0A0A9DTN0_ARUDO
MTKLPLPLLLQCSLPNQALVSPAPDELACAELAYCCWPRVDLQSPSAPVDSSLCPSALRAPREFVVVLVALLCAPDDGGQKKDTLCG